jgi:hypothetical protein
VVSILEDAGLFALVILGLYATGWLALDLLYRRRARQNEREQLKPCERCGKPVLAGSENYHRKHCLGKPKELKVERRWKGGPRE